LQQQRDEAKHMAEDKWLLDLAHALRHARTRAELNELIDRLEDQYDAFSGPGQEMAEQLLDEARRRLQGLG
jgi:hypothetical protein